MAQKYVNNAYSTMVSAIGTGDTAITVGTGHGDRWPVIAAPDICYTTLEDALGNIEIVKVTARAAGSDVLTVTRAQQNTSARAWAIGDLIELRITATELGRFERAALRDGDTYTGTHDFTGAAVRVPATPTNNNEPTSKSYVDGLAFGAVQLPAQAGNAGKFVKTNGTTASWEYAGISTVETTSSATHITLTAADIYTYRSISMTAMGKSVNLPDATTCTKGGPVWILKNDGGYPFGIRDSAGTLVMAVAPGGIAYLTLKDNSTAAGGWSVIGDNLEPGLITIDNTFSGTYSATVLKPFVALDNSKSIHFLVDAAGNALYAVAVDNATGTVGTPTLVDGATAAPRAVFKVSSTSCILFYSNRAVVITLSGSTTLSVGTYAVAGDSAMFSAEDFSGAPKIAQLTSTLYLASYTSGTNTSVVAVSVSGTTVAIGSAANIITANSVAGSTTTYALTATTGLVIYESGTSPYQVNAVVVSVSGTTCTVGTPANSTAYYIHNTSTPVSSCLLSPTKALVAYQCDSFTSVNAQAITINGTTVSFGARLDVETVGSGLASGYGDSMATRYNPHLSPLDSSRGLLWYHSVGNGVSRAVVLTESGGTVMAGTINYGAVSVAATNAAGGGAILPQGVSEFVAIRTRVASSAGYSMFIVPASITGNSIAVGKSAVLPAATLGDPAQQLCGRFASGKYLLQGFNNGNVGTLEATVFESNGDSIRVCGGIKLPPINPLSTMGPMAVVSNSRVVLLGSQTNTSTGGQGGLRLLNVEIAQ